MSFEEQNPTLADLPSTATLSERIVEHYRWLFPDETNEVGTAALDQLLADAKILIAKAGEADGIRPDINAADLSDFCAIHGGLERENLFFSQLAQKPEVLPLT